MHPFAGASGLRALRARIQQKGLMTLRRGTAVTSATSSSQHSLCFIFGTRVKIFILEILDPAEGRLLAFRLSAWEGYLVRCVHRVVIKTTLLLVRQLSICDLPENAQQRFLVLLTTMIRVEYHR